MAEPRFTSSSGSTRFSSTRKKEDLSTLEGLKAKATKAGLKKEAEKALKNEKVQSTLNAAGRVLNIGTAVVAGGFRGFLRDDISVLGGMKQGVSKNLSFGNVLREDFGINPETAKGKTSLGVASFILDVGLDPITYLSFGASAGLKVGGKTLTKAATKKTVQAIERESIEIAARLARKGITKPVSQIKNELIDKTILGSGKIADDILKNPKAFDAGGVKFFGSTILTPKTIKRGTRKVIDPVAKIAAKVPGGEVLGTSLSTFTKALGKIFKRDAGLPEEFVGLKQKALDGLARDTDVIVERTTSLFKGVSVSGKEAITRALDEGDAAIKALPKPLRGKAISVKEEFVKIAKRESNLGILNSTLDDYVSHLYKNKEEAESLLSNFRTGLRATNKFDTKRVIPTIKEAEKLGLVPELDIAKVLVIRSIASQKALRAHQLLQRTATKFGEKQLQLSKGFVKYPAKGIPDGVAIPRAIAKDLDNWSSKAISDESLNVVLRGYDKVLAFWKGSLTTIFPAFHGRNAISNVAQNFLDINIQAINPMHHGRVLKIMKGFDGEIISKHGRTYTYKEIRNLAKSKGVFGSPGMRDVVDTIEQELAAGLRKDGVKSANDLLRAVGRGVKPTSQNSLFRAGRKVGNVIEDEARLANFVANLQRGASPDDAAKSVKNFLFDYGNLSNTEREVFRRLIPFYTFTRKNLEMQLKALSKNPRYLTGQVDFFEAFNQGFGIELSDDEKENLPEWIQNSLGIVIDKDEFGRPVFLTGLGLPIEEAMQTFDAPGKKLLSSLSPLIKAPLEQATGRDFFRERPLKEVYNADEFKRLEKLGFLGKGVQEYLGIKKVEKSVYRRGKKIGTEDRFITTNPERLALIRNLPTSRFLSTLAALDKKEVPPLMRFLRTISGIKAYNIDPEANKYFNDKDKMRALEDLLIKMGEVKRRWGR